MPNARHALLIGIDQYPRIPNAELQGAAVSLPVGVRR